MNTDANRETSGAIATLVKLVLLFGWIALKLAIVTAMLDRSITQFIYAGF